MFLDRTTLQCLTSLAVFAARRYEYLDEDAPDPDESDLPSEGPSLPGSPPAIPASPPAAAPPQAAPPSPSARPARSGWDMSQMMWLAGGSGLPAVIARSEVEMPAEGLPVASERAGGESRRTGLKRKASEITRSAAEDFALLTTQTVSERYAADFLSTVANVGLIVLNQTSLLQFYLNCYVPAFLYIGRRTLSNTEVNVKKNY